MVKFYSIYLFLMDSESICVERFNQRIGVSGMATAFRIISRFCLNRIWLEELNQLCPRITEMTLEGSLESTGQSIDGFLLRLQWCRETLVVSSLLFFYISAYINP
ncbi:hypothetical protein ATANTOWER_005014 [Ataeniobius toweri]|uniref:Uncharacterized protein n=1 Tax=Ataeniobius toweri TaxID=208326 RepID=A0ABU7AEF1_9TELE|nr:hypothetical protein [Ataeniobius toweri]